MDYIAVRGYDVYLLDLRGYGKSTRPKELAEPSEANPPIVRTDTAVKDIAAAVDFICARRSIPRLVLLGWSWRTFSCPAYAIANPGKVERLVLYAPILPALLVTMAWDSEVPPTMARTLFPLLVNSPGKRLVELPRGTHNVLMETNRFELFEAVQKFLDEGGSPPRASGEGDYSKHGGGGDSATMIPFHEYDEVRST